MNSIVSALLERFPDYCTVGSVRDKCPEPLIVGVRVYIVTSNKEYVMNCLL